MCDIKNPFTTPLRPERKFLLIALPRKSNQLTFHRSNAFGSITVLKNMWRIMENDRLQKLTSIL